MTKEQEALIDQIIKWGCSCDLMNGYVCGCCQVRIDLQRAFEKGYTASSGWDADRGDGFNSRGYEAGQGIYHNPMG